MFRPWTTLAKVGLVVVAPFIILTFYHQPSLPITSCHLEPHYLSGFSIPRIHGTGNQLTNFRNNSMISLHWRFISLYLIFFCSFRIKTTHLLSTLWTFLTYLIAPWDYLSNSSPSFHSRSYMGCRIQSAWSQSSLLLGDDSNGRLGIIRIIRELPLLGSSCMLLPRSSWAYSGSPRSDPLFSLIRHLATSR